MGEAREAGRGEMGGHLYRGRTCASGGAGTSTGTGHAVLSRARSRAVRTAISAAERRRRQQSWLLRSCCFPSAVRCQKRVMTTSLPRWRCCRPIWRGVLCISVAGHLAAVLRKEAERLGLSDRIEWRGPRAQPDVLAAYREADLFVLAAKVANDGDRDGLPNVLMEAQSQRLACIATDVSGIPELIRNGITGVLVPPGNPSALAGALGELIRDPQRRAALGAAGERRVRAQFSMNVGVDMLARALWPRALGCRRRSRREG